MYALADKYAMPDLQIESLCKFAYTMQALVGHHEERSAVLEVMPLVYDGTPDSDRGLRDPVAEFAAKHWDWFKVQAEIQDGAPNGFLLDVASALGRQLAADKLVSAKTEAWRAYARNSASVQRVPS